MEYFEPEFTLGLTATPDRLDRLDISVILGEVLYSLDFIEAISKGYLAKVEVDFMMDEVLRLGQVLDKDNNVRVSLNGA